MLVALAFSLLKSSPWAIAGVFTQIHLSATEVPPKQTAHCLPQLRFEFRRRPCLLEFPCSIHLDFTTHSFTLDHPTQLPRAHTVGAHEDFPFSRASAHTSTFHLRPCVSVSAAPFLCVWAHTSADAPPAGLRFFWPDPSCERTCPP